jgi:hypothetical protein
MENEYIKDDKIKEMSEDEKNKELLLNIIKTRESLKQAHKNFEFAENDLIDYYSYNIKANQAKLDYLIKLAKSKGLVMDVDIQNQLEMIREVS